MKQTNTPSDNQVINSDSNNLILHLQSLFDSLNDRNEQISRRPEAIPHLVTNCNRQHFPLYVATVGIAASFAIIIICTLFLAPPKHYDDSTLQRITSIINQI